MPGKLELIDESRCFSVKDDQILLCDKCKVNCRSFYDVDGFNDCDENEGDESDSIQIH